MPYCFHSVASTFFLLFLFNFYRNMRKQLDMDEYKKEREWKTIVTYEYIVISINCLNLILFSFFTFTKFIHCSTSFLSQCSSSSSRPVVVEKKVLLKRREEVKEAGKKKHRIQTIFITPLSYNSYLFITKEIKLKLYFTLFM